MADFTLKDGKELTFDLDAFTYEEYFKLFETDDRDYTAELVGKATGLGKDEIKALGFATRRSLESAFFKKCREPLSDPNSDSAPTSP